MKLPARDHTGRIYDSLKAMQRMYSDRVEYSTMLHRLTNGWSIEEAINGRKKRGKLIKYNRRTYASIASICRYFGLNCNRVAQSLKRGKSIRDIIKKIMNEYKEKLNAYHKRIEDKLSGMDEWHKRRYNGIGGSEIATVMGLNPYQTPYDLWLVKTGRELPFSGNGMTDFGTYMEQYVAEKYEKITGYKVEVDKTHYSGENIDAPQLVGNIDRLVTLPDGTKRILECKTARDASGTDATSEKSWGEGNSYFNGKQVSSDDRIPANYYLQVQLYMLITGIKQCDLCVLFRSDCTVRIYSIPFDANICEKIVCDSREFWMNVLDDVPPTQIVKDYEKSKKVSEKSSELTFDELEVVYGLNEINKKMDVLKAQQEELEEKLKTIIGNNESASYDGKVFATWKVQTRKSIDTAKLKKEHPDIASRYQKETVYRVFRLTNIKEN